METENLTGNAMKRELIILLASTFITACVNAVPETFTNDGSRLLTAAPPENTATRTNISDKTPEWCAGDCIWISNGQKSISVTLRQEDIRPDGKFEIRISDMPGKLYTAYPAEYVTGFTDGQVTISFPDCPDGSFGSANVCAATVEESDGNIQYRNLGSVFRLQIDSDLVAKAEKVEISCPGISGQYRTSAEDITILSPVSSSTSDKMEVSTSGLSELYVGVPPLTMPAGAKFVFKDSQGSILYTRATSKDNTIGRNCLLDLSFCKEEVRLVQNSLLDPAWHEGDEVTLTDGTNTEKHVIAVSDINPDGSVTVRTQLLIRDNSLKAVCPSSGFMGTDADGNVLINIPDSQDGSADGADITYAECADGVLTFSTAAPVIRMSGMPGAAKSLAFNADYVSGGQKMVGGKMQSTHGSGHSKLSLGLTRRGESIYYIAVSPSATEGTIHYFDGEGKDIGTNQVTFLCSATSVWEYGPLRDIATIDLGDGWNNWIGYYPDDAFIPDLIISGTHDSGTFGYDGLLGGQVKCQDLNFSDQLKKGVRCFDLRLSENMNIFHGTFYCNTGLGSFLDTCLDFLNSHPREVVFCFAKDENAEGEEQLWNQHFQEQIDAHGRSNFIIDKNLASYELGQLRGKVVITTRNRSAGSFGYLEGAPQISWPDDTWTTCTSGGDIQIALEDNYTAEKGDPKKNKILDFLSAIKNDGGYMRNGHRTRWIVAFTSGYKGYAFGIPWPEDFCNDLLKTDIVSRLQNEYDGLSRDGITYFHDFTEKWDSYSGHLFESYVRKK